MMLVMLCILVSEYLNTQKYMNYLYVSSRHGQDQQDLAKIVTEKLSNFILSLMSEYFKLTEARIELEVICWSYFC